MGQDLAQKTCFVVMGFGEKTDFQTQRVLDLDKTYRIIIKRAVEDAGLKCIRADDVVHSGTIDKPMYELLLNADLVVADLSTSNPNAIYELGVRHALRPNTTIVIAESQFRFPFDIGHLLIRTYEHLGKGIDAEEAERVRSELRKAIETLVRTPEPDSPVYTFLPALRPPTIAATEVAKSAAELAPAGWDSATVGTPAAKAEVPSALLDAFRAARAQNDFVTAKALLSKLREQRPNDPYVVQQLALATYKSGLPSPKEALIEAHGILQGQHPASSHDSETLGLWGAIHKRLWGLTLEREHLDAAIDAYERGFYLRNDHYTGINYAFLLNVRASLSESRDAIADTVLAERVRRRVIALGEVDLANRLRDEESQAGAGRAEAREQAFWLYASLVEAHAGIGDTAGAEASKTLALALQPEPWMVETLDQQLAQLKTLLAAGPA